MKMHEDEIEIDAELVRRLLAGQFPALAGLAVRRVPSTGTVNALFRLGDRLCARLPLQEKGVDNLEKECRWLPALAP
jgi:aminoglycoside phosphotransferase (APT) family kinase protein